MKSWMIIADDLTGAADCAIAFAKNDIATSVIFDNSEAQTDVASIDVGSRPFPAGKAADMHRRALERRFKPGMLLYKKIDSLIRGQPAAETAATIAFLKEHKAGSFAVLAPAFPSIGRTTKDAGVLMNGAALETTEIWAREHTYENANLVAVLQSAGVKALGIPLAAVRRGSQAVAELISTAMGDGYDGVVCDAESDDDLQCVAQSTLPMADKLFWIGTGGLAVPLAKLSKPDTATAPVSVPPRTEGILVFVGSLAKASRDGIAHILSIESIRHVVFPPEALFEGRRDVVSDLAKEVVTALKAGHDVLGEIGAVDDPDFSKGAELAKKLAEALREAMGVASGFVVTGGETAAALLAAAGVGGIRLIREVESGVPAGVTIGNISIPIVTKSGSFGTEQTLAKGLELIRSVQKKGSF